MLMLLAILFGVAYVMFKIGFYMIQFCPSIVNEDDLDKGGTLTTDYAYFKEQLELAHHQGVYNVRFKGMNLTTGQMLDIHQDKFCMNFVVTLSNYIAGETICEFTIKPTGMVH